MCVYNYIYDYYIHPVTMQQDTVSYNIPPKTNLHDKCTVREDLQNGWLHFSCLQKV